MAKQKIIQPVFQFGEIAVLCSLVKHMPDQGLLLTQRIGLASGQAHRSNNVDDKADSAQAGQRLQRQQPRQPSAERTDRAAIHGWRSSRT